MLGTAVPETAIHENWCETSPFERLKNFYACRFFVFLNSIGTVIFQVENRDVIPLNFKKALRILRWLQWPAYITVLS